MKKLTLTLIIALAVINNIKSEPLPAEYFTNFETIKNKAIPALPQCKESESAPCQNTKKEVEEFINAVKARYGYFLNSSFTDVPYFQKINKKAIDNSKTYSICLEAFSASSLFGSLLTFNPNDITDYIEDFNTFALAYHRYPEAEKIISQTTLKQYLLLLQKNPNQTISLENFLIHELIKQANPETVAKKVEILCSTVALKNSSSIEDWTKWKRVHEKIKAALQQSTPEQRKQEAKILLERFPLEK